MAATTSYYCDASELGQVNASCNDGWGVPMPASSAWSESPYASRGPRPTLPPGLPPPPPPPPPPSFACPVNVAAGYRVPPLPAWDPRERMYDGRHWNRQQQDGAPTYAMSDASATIYAEAAWRQHRQHCRPFDVSCGVPINATSNFPERMRDGPARSLHVQNGFISYAPPNPQSRTNQGGTPRRYQNGSTNSCRDLHSLAPASNERMPRRKADRRFQNGTKERRQQNYRRQNGALAIPGSLETMCDGRPRQRHHRNGPPDREVKTPCTYGYNGATYLDTQTYSAENNLSGDHNAGSPLEPPFASAMSTVRHSSRLPCDQYLSRFPAFADFRAAATLAAAAVAVNGSGYLCPAAQPFVNARNEVDQPPSRAVDSPPMLRAPRGVSVVIRKEDGTICRCIQPGSSKHPGTVSTRHPSPAEDTMVLSCLSKLDEGRLESQTLELVRGLTPGVEWYTSRKIFLEKLRKVLAWSNHADIEIFMFGSTVSGLATLDSDADVYVRTGRKTITVRSIANFLRRGGMEQLVVVDAAKVQIVKFYDTVLGIKCDINIDGKLALVNTRLIKSYVSIDWRVRALIVTIKHWAKRRGLNAAAEKTLSSYAWSCLCINHLQTRNPPILPSLHVLAQKRRANATSFHCADSTAIPTDPDGRPRSPSPVSTASELDEEEEKEAENFLCDLSDAEVAGFGAKNTETVAGLLCSFFKSMAYEFDYHNTVVSVRQGTQISKIEKGWNVGGCNVGRGRPYRVLAIEDPINIKRNLANSADETAVAGLRHEFRRAWKLLCQTGNLAELCEPWREQAKEDLPQPEHAGWPSRFSQEEVIADLEDFRRTQPAPRSISSMSDLSTCSSESLSRRSSIFEESTPPTSAECTSLATYHGLGKTGVEEAANCSPESGNSAIEPTPLPPVELANPIAAESQVINVAEEVLPVSPLVGHAIQSTGPPVAKNLSMEFVGEERAEDPDPSQSGTQAAPRPPPPAPAPPSPPALLPTGETNDRRKSRSRKAERKPSDKVLSSPPPAEEYKQDWPTLVEAGARARRNRRSQTTAPPAPGKPAPSKAESDAARDVVAKPPQSPVPAVPRRGTTGAPKRVPMGIGRGIPFPQVKVTPQPQPPAPRTPSSRQHAHDHCAPAPFAATAPKPEGYSRTRRAGPAWAKLPATNRPNDTKWPSLAASCEGGKKKRRN